MMYLLLDIDHTISNAFWRDPMIGAQPWDEYHAASKDDKPFKNMIGLVNSLSSMGYTIVAVTGRNEKFRQLTLNWFLKYRIDVDELLMRPDDDFTKNAELKLELIKKFKVSDIHFAIDDNEDACIAFQKLGITSLQIRNVSGEPNVTAHEGK
jgi:phosphoglycolate phosphatase-like HAD superfamily hydrolase